MASLVNWMIFAPTLGGLLCLLAGKKHAKWLALATVLVTLVLSIVLAVGYHGCGYHGVQFESAASWIGSINAEYRVGVDGLSLPLVLLTTSLSVLAVIASWKIDKAVPGYMALYLFLLTGMLGVFLALDLFLFYVFFELSLLPMYFLIGIWGGPRKEYAAIKFFLYTLAGSVCLLAVMLGLFYLTPGAGLGLPGSGNTWSMMALQGREASICVNGATVPVHGAKLAALFAHGGGHWRFAQWAFWLTFIAFALKVPIAPLHTWLPDAHVEAPTPISMILAGVLLKMGGYALMRISYPFFPDAARLYWPCVACIGVFSIVYGALCAMAQSDWKKLVAYSSVSHMGYVILGLAVLTRQGFDGAYFQMIAHGITSAMMFFMVGLVYDRAHHRQINRLGGLWLKYPAYGGWSLLCFFAGLGLPGLCGFIGEVLVLLGTFAAAGQVPPEQRYLVYTFGIIAASAVVLTAGYILWMFQRVYLGPARPEYEHYSPIQGREYLIMSVLGVAALVFGLAPILIFKMTDPTFSSLFDIIRMKAS